MPRSVMTIHLSLTTFYIRPSDRLPSEIFVRYIIKVLQFVEDDSVTSKNSVHFYLEVQTVKKVLYSFKFKNTLYKPKRTPDDNTKFYIKYSGERFPLGSL